MRRRKREGSVALQLGAGGMATVHLQCHANGMLVARKRMHSHLVSDPQMRELFEREAHIHQLVVGKNVCRLHEYDLGSEPSLSLEYIRGVSLQRLLGHLPNEEGLLSTLPIVEDLLSALSTVHASRSASGEPANLIHGDVAPDNVLVSFDGVSKIIDFGVAAQSDSKHEIRGGRIPYQSPERIVGEPFDQRADQWSLAVLLYELLTGSHPFRRASEPATFHAIAEAKVELPSKVAPSDRRAWLEVLDEPLTRALSRDPASRYRDVASFGEAVLERLAPQAADRQILKERIETRFSTLRARLIQAEKELLATGK